VCCSISSRLQTISSSLSIIVIAPRQFVVAVVVTCCCCCCRCYTRNTSHSWIYIQSFCVDIHGYIHIHRCLSSIIFFHHTSNSTVDFYFLLILKRTAKLGVRKWETSLYRMCTAYFDILNVVHCRCDKCVTDGVTRICYRSNFRAQLHVAQQKNEVHVSEENSHKTLEISVDIYRCIYTWIYL